MKMTTIETNMIGMNEEYLDDPRSESDREYILRKRRADLVFVVSKILNDELSEKERKILLGMLTEDKAAKDFTEEMNTSVAQIYRIRDRALHRVEEIIKYVLLYRNEREQCVVPPLELRRILTLAKTHLTDCPTIVHRLKKLMARECIGVEMLYKTPGLSQKAVNEIFSENRVPSVQEIIAFSDFFDTSADYILKGDKPCKKH